MGEVHDFDAGDLGCGTALPGAFAEHMRSIAVGDVLRATVSDAAAREDLPALARMLGHRHWLRFGGLVSSGITG